MGSTQAFTSELAPEKLKSAKVYVQFKISITTSVEVEIKEIFLVT